MAMTMSGTTLTFNDNSTMTVAGASTGWLEIGSIALLVCTSNGGFAAPGSTASGGTLFRITTVGSNYITAGFVAYGNGNTVNNTSSFGSAAPGGSGGTYTSVGGTWRNISHGRANQATYQAYENYTVMGLLLAIRTA
jgi:hypothetical protein